MIRCARALRPRRRLWPRLICALLAACTGASISQADVTLDGTMGPGGPLAGPDFTIPDSAGKTVGANLFHSFGEFNLDSNQSATFTGPAGVENVLSRITGGASTIDGAVRSTIPNADLYLLNSAGIVFGPNASLDVQGAFHASTADHLGLADGTRFTALPSSGDASLTTAAPVAFGFLGDTPATIEVEGSHLEVPQGETLALVGGDISIAGAELSAEGGTINLLSVGAPEEVAFTSPRMGDGVPHHGSITVTESTLDVSGDTGGPIFIQGGEIVIDLANVLSDTGSGDGGHITLNGDSVVVQRGTESGGIVRTRTSGAGKGGDIRVEADSLQVVDGIRLRTETRGPGAGGDIVVDVTRMELMTGADVDTRTFDSGRGGDITVDADSVLISGGGSSSTNLRSIVNGPFAFQNYTDLGPGASGNGGNVTVNAGDVQLTGGRIQTTTYGIGRGGDVRIEADRVSASNPEKTRNTGLRVRVGDGDIPLELRDVIQGDAGNLTVKAGNVEVLDGAVFDTTTFGAGRAGDLTVEADSVLLSGEGSSLDGFGSDTGLEAESAGAGDGGTLTVRAGTLEVRDKAFVTANTMSEGAGGNVIIEADQVLVAGGRGITVNTGGAGEGGTLTIVTGKLEVQGPASVGVTTASQGAGGNITIEADEILVSGGGANINAAAVDTGNGGTVTIKAGHVEVSGPLASISGITLGAGRGGDITVEAENVLVSGGGLIDAATFDTGDAGNVTLVVDSLLLVGDGTTPQRGPFDQFNPFTSVQSSSFTVASDTLQGKAGDAGDVSVTANQVELRDGATMESITLFSGEGGNVSVNTDRLLIRSGSRIDVSTLGSGSGGDINVTANTITLTGEGVEGFTGISAVAEPGATGIAGDIRIQVGDTFESFSGSVTAAADQSDGGNIEITATKLVHLVDSSIETAVQGGAGSGGNIFIDPDFVVLNNSRIIANAFGGPGGNINIVAGNFIADDESVVEASSAAGIDGTVSIDSPDSDVTSGITVLPGAFLDASTLLRAPCAARAQVGSSSLAAAGRSGLPVDPDNYLPSPGVFRTDPTQAVNGLDDSTAMPSDTSSGTNSSVLMNFDCNG